MSAFFITADFLVYSLHLQLSTSAFWRVQTLTLYSHMQMKLHMHDEKYDVDIFAACSQLEILRRKKKVIRC